MIGVLTHHWAKPDKIAEAKKLLDGNGLAQSKAPGFGSRETPLLPVRPGQDYHPGHLGKQRDL